MAGDQKTFIFDVITKDHLFVCLKLKEVTVSEDSQQKNGHLLQCMPMIVRQCCLICLAVVIFPAKTKETR